MCSYSLFTIAIYPMNPFIIFIKGLLNLRIKDTKVLLKATVLELMKKWILKNRPNIELIRIFKQISPVYTIVDMFTLSLKSHLSFCTTLKF